MPTRHAMIWMDGAADEPLAERDGRTPLEVAATPHCDAICAVGRQGTVRTIPPDGMAEPDVALVSLSGYDPRHGYTGLGALEATARKIRLGTNEIAFRCNLVTLGGGVLLDATGGGIGTSEAGLLIDALNQELADLGARFHVGEGHGHLMVLKDAAEARVSIASAHAIEGEATATRLPRGRDGERLREILRRAERVLSAHDVNHVRHDLGENPANAIWLWGGGRTPRWKRFRSRFDLRGTLVTTTPMARGLATLLGWPVSEAAPPTGDPDADAAALGRAALAAIEEFDLVIVHADGPCAATLRGQADAKIHAIEAIDRDIVGPLCERLRRFDRHRILVAATLAGRVKRRRFADEPPPYCTAGALVEPDPRRGGFGETSARQTGLQVEVGSDLMEYFLRA